MLARRGRRRFRIAAALCLGAALSCGCALGFREATSPRIARPAGVAAAPTIGDERLRAALNDAHPYRWTQGAGR